MKDADAPGFAKEQRKFYDEDAPEGTLRGRYSDSDELLVRGHFPVRAAQQLRPASVSLLLLPQPAAELPPAPRLF